MGLVAVAVAVAGVIGGFALSEERWAAFGVIFLLGCGGLALGWVQGYLDRVATADAFLLHRPVSVERIHVARTLGGAVTVLLAVCWTVVVMFLWPSRHGYDLLQLRFDPVLDPLSRGDFTGGVAAFALLFAGAVWAAARFGASARDPRAAVCLGVLLPVMLAFTVLRIPSIAASTALLVATLVVATAATVLRLSARSGE